MGKDKTINPADLPQSEAYVKTDVYQQKHVADMGKPNNENAKLNQDLEGKTAERTSTHEGLTRRIRPVIKV